MNRLPKNFPPHGLRVQRIRLTAREVVAGTASRMGLERPAMIHRGIGDISHFIKNEARFLEEFA